MDTAAERVFPRSGRQASAGGGPAALKGRRSGGYGPVVNVQEYAAIATASEPRMVLARLAV
jgi:hypothetical protein